MKTLLIIVVIISGLFTFMCAVNQDDEHSLWELLPLGTFIISGSLLGYLE